MNAALRRLLTKRIKGQSLVETAIFMPVLVILLAGVVEVSNLLVTQNRVSTAARAATGYGAATFSGDEWEDASIWPEAMANTALNNVTATLELEPERWDIWAIHAQVNDAGDAFSEWTAEHGYGNNTVMAALEPTIQGDIFDELQATADSAPINGLEIAATVAYHDRRSLLGLNGFNFGPLTRVRGLTVMRVDQPAPYTGCPILPISVRFDQYSAYPSNWTGEQYVRVCDGPNCGPKYPDDPINLFPSGNVANGGFEYPNPPLTYLNDEGAGPGVLAASTFKNNIPGIPLRDMSPYSVGQQRGTIFVAREQGPGGGFGWLSWDGSPSAESLRDSLVWPGNFMETYPGSDADMGTTGDFPFSATGDEDGVLEFGPPVEDAEWLENSTGNIHAAESEIGKYIDEGHPGVVIVYDETNNLNGENANYRAIGLVKVNILGYSFQGTNDEKWIMFEFLSWGTKCE